MIDLDNLDDARRDRWDRYLVVPPGGDSQLGYTRVTTVAKATDDGGGLIPWKATQTVVGVMRRPGLRGKWEALIARNVDPWYASEASKKACKKLVEECAEAGGATDRADLGTAHHAIFEEYDHGRTPTISQEVTRADLAAYVAAIEAAGITFDREYIEATVVLDEWQVAGKADRLVTTIPGIGNVVADLKTGAELKYSWQSIAVQIAAYAHADAVYVQGDAGDGSDDRRLPMPAVSQEVGLIIHAPAGEARCDLYLVDLVAGWEAFRQSMWVRKWRGRRDLVRPFTPAADVGNNRIALDLLGRAQKLSAHAAEAQQWCTMRWPQDCPRLTEPLTPEQRDAVAHLLDEAETFFSAPFDPTPDDAPPHGIPRPVVKVETWQRPYEGAEVDGEAVRAEMDKLVASAPELVTWCQVTFGEARACGRPIIVDKRHTERSHAITRAVVAVGRASDLDDELVRHLLAATLGADAALFPAVSVGMAFGSLTIAEANRLAEVAERCASERIGIAFTLEGAPALSGDLADLPTA